MKSYTFEVIEHGMKYPAKAFVTSIEHSCFHWHYEYELILVLKGTLSVNTGPAPVLLGTGDILLINSKAVHELQRTKEDNLCLFIQMSQTLFRDFKDENRTYHFYLNSRSEGMQPKKDYRSFVRLAARIGLEFQRSDIGGYYRVKSLLYQLVADLFETVPYEIHQRAALTKGNENAKLLMGIIEFLQENLKKGTVLEELYKTLGMSEKTVHRFLKCSVGLTTKEFLTGFRIEAAKSLLKFTDKSISYIGNECGFGSENTFYRVFKKEVGVTPNEYRHNGAALDKNPEVKGYLSFSWKEAEELLKNFI